MDAARFLTTTETGLLTALSLEGQPVVKQHQRLQDFLEKQGLVELLAFFSEPVPGRPGTSGYQSVSWYSPLQGEVLSLTDLSGSDRVAAESQLRQNLTQLRPYLDHPEVGRLLQRALVIPGLEDCKVVFGHVVLLNWGFCPGAPASDARYFPSHWAATLGRYTDFTPEPPSGEPVGVSAPAAALGAAGVAAGAAVLAGGAAAEASETEPGAAGLGESPEDGSVPPPPPPGSEGGEPVTPPPVPPAVAAVPWYRRWGCLVPLILLLVLACLLAWWLWSRWAGSQRASARLGSLVEAQEGVNQALEDQIARLKAQLAGDVCAAKDQALPGPSRTLLPKGVVPEPPAGAPAAAAPRNLAELLERSTVLVVSPTPDGQDATMGTAFFVTPEVLLTNRHVVENAGPKGVIITNRVLGQVRICKVVAISQEEARDYALLRLEGPTPAKVTPLGFTTGVQKLDHVVAAGYPGLITSDDPKLRALLLGGDAKAVPEMVFSAGEVAVILERRVPLIVHTAVVSMGNSGGPLVDRCGRVVGINTMIKVDENSRHQGNYALASSDILAFLGQHGISAGQTDQRCQGGSPQ